jgi:hypothetical protein
LTQTSAQARMGKTATAITPVATTGPAPEPCCTNTENSHTTTTYTTAAKATTSP